MTLKNFIRRNDGVVLTEVLIGGVAFVVVGLMVAHYALNRNAAPLTELQTEPQAPRLIAIE